MSELLDMLRVQARLHRKQGANALGQLFESAIEEIKLLKKTYNQLFDAFQDCQGELAKANERVAELEKELANKELLHVGFTNGDQIKNGVVEEGSFYRDTKGCCYIPLYMLKSHEHRIETTSIEQLRKEQENG
ncbi:MAG: hypothetical protein AAF364_09320 [Pseudomonadota bacterium]